MFINFKSPEGKMGSFEIVAHRGVPSPEAPENTIPSYQKAIEFGADAIELDVRLTASEVLG